MNVLSTLIKLKKARWGPWVGKDMNKRLRGAICLPHTRTHARTKESTYWEVLPHNTKHISHVLQRAPQTFMTTETRTSFRLGFHYTQRHWSHSSYILYLSTSAKDRHYNLGRGEIRNQKSDLAWCGNIYLSQKDGTDVFAMRTILIGWSWNETTNPVFPFLKICKFTCFLLQSKYGFSSLKLHHLNQISHTKLFIFSTFFFFTKHKIKSV